MAYVRLFRPSANNQGTLYRKDQEAVQLFQGQVGQRHQVHRLHEDGTIFTRKLYNYSRDELKEILMEDRHMISELNKEISQNIHEK